jgi:hypothetical protein
MFRLQLGAPAQKVDDVFLKGRLDRAGKIAGVNDDHD